jgi:hypothetical protein
MIFNEYLPSEQSAYILKILQAPLSARWGMASSFILPASCISFESPSNDNNQPIALHMVLMDPKL